MKKFKLLKLLTPLLLLTQFPLNTNPPLSQAYNEDGRVCSITSSDSSSMHTYTYDENGLPNTTTNLSTKETISRIYSKEGLLLREEFPNNLSVSFTWNEKGQREETILPDSSSITYTYIQDQLVSVTRKNPIETYTHAFTRDANGKILEEHLSYNLGSIFHTYDENGRRIGLKTPIGEEKIESFTEQQLISKAHRFSGDYSFEYDNENQLILETGPYIHSYQYDLEQNRLNTPPLPNITLSFDALDRLIVAEDSEMRLEISYDGFHRKLSQTLFKYEQETWIEIEKRYFIYDHQNEIGSYTLNSLGQIEWEDLRIITPQEGACPPQTVAAELRQQPFAVISDLYGNGAALISLKTGEVTETIAYTAFQEESSPFTPQLPWRLNGKRTLPLCGFVDFGRRLYLPEQGRWLTVDPSGDPDGPNRLAYAKNNPLLLQDPYGLESFLSPIFSNISQTFQDFFKHMIPLSSTRFLGVYIGECFSTGPIAGINYHSHLGSIGEHPSGSRHINLWINGINTTFEETISAAQMISEACGNEKVYYVYHPTQGFMGDLWDHIFSKLHLRGNTPYLTALGVRMALEEVGEAGKLTIFAHSNGGAILSMALPYLTQEEKNKIEIYTFGTGRFFFPNGVAKITHILSDWDPWPLATDSFRYVLFYIWNPPFFQIKKSSETGLTKVMRNHAFKGPVYSEELYRIGKEIQEEQKREIKT